MTCVAHSAVQAVTAWPFSVALMSEDGQFEWTVSLRARWRIEMWSQLHRLYSYCTGSVGRRDQGRSGEL